MVGQDLESPEESPHELLDRKDEVRQLKDLHDALASTRNDIRQAVQSSSRAKERLFKQTWALLRTLHEEVISSIDAVGPIVRLRRLARHARETRPT